MNTYLVKAPADTYDELIQFFIRIGLSIDSRSFPKQKTAEGLWEIGWCGWEPEIINKQPNCQATLKSGRAN